jgi:CheY-specific phosphatase CheX
MTSDAPRLEKALDAVAERARNYLQNEAAINITRVRKAVNGVHSVTLENLTAMIGIGGPSGILAAFNYSPELSDALFRHTTQGLDVSADEEQIFRHGTLTEFANVILGNAIPDAFPFGESISMTPPVILEGATRIHYRDDTVFGCVSIATDRGSLDIHLVGPQKMFDQYLKSAM